MKSQVETEKKMCPSQAQKTCFGKWRDNPQKRCHPCKQEYDCRFGTANPHDKRERIAKWFHARFGLMPSQDRLYFDEWLHRFATGSAYRFMDSESLELWNKVRKGEI